jgi:hypothetical protein
MELHSPRGGMPRQHLQWELATRFPRP